MMEKDLNIRHIVLNIKKNTFTSILNKELAMKSENGDLGQFRASIMEEIRAMIQKEFICMIHDRCCKVKEDAKSLKSGDSIKSGVLEIHNAISAFFIDDE